MAYTQRFFANCTDEIDLLAITHDVKRAVSESKVQQGLVSVYLPISAGGMAVVESDLEVREALRDLIVRLIPETSGSRPDRRSKTGAIHAHLRGLMLQTSLTLPVADGQLGIGHWQEIILYDFDDRIARREFIVHVIGEGGEGETATGGAVSGGRGGGSGKSLPPGKAKMV